MKSARTPGANAGDWQAGHIDEARYQHMTVRVLGVMTAISAVFSVLAAAGLFISSIPPDTLAGLLLLSVFFYAGWRAAAKGHWRMARHIPVASIFLGAVYGNYIGGMGAPAVLMYVLSVVLSAMLQGRSARVLVFAASLASYSTLAVLHHLDILTAIRSDETAFQNRGGSVWSFLLYLPGIFGYPCRHGGAMGTFFGKASPRPNIHDRIIEA